LRNASSAPMGYLAILMAGLLLCLGVRFEANRQYLTTWQHYLESQQMVSKDYNKRVKVFFAALNDNLTTLSFLPNVRKIDRHGFNLGADGRETIQQVYNNLAKNVGVTKIYIVPLSFDAGKIDLETGSPEEPILALDKILVSSKISGSDFASVVPAPPRAIRLAEYVQFEKQLQFFKINYPKIHNVETSDVPMTSGPEILTSDNTNTIKPRVDNERAGLVFSVPFYDQDGKLAGSVAAVILSSVLRNITDSDNYSLISPLAEYISVPFPRNVNIRLMMHAADYVPSPATIFSETVVVDTNDVRGKWQLHMKYPLGEYYSGAQFWTKRYFEYGSYSALGVLSLLGLGWHRSNVKRADDMKENASALQRVNDDITRLNIDLAENMRQLHEAQDEIIKKGKLAQMGQLVATVAHELRNPLSAVRTSAYLLRRKLAGQAINVDAQLSRIDNSVTRCDAVITQFLDYAKSQQLEYKKADFDSWVVKLVEEEAQKLPAMVAVECDLGLNEKIVSFDPGRLTRVLINLISNASEAMVGKGDDPSKFATQSPKITIATRQSGNRIELDVRDTGPGIPEEYIAKVLEPLFTTKSFGTGLGLPAVVQVLEQHGGGLTVDGGLGTGATFTAWIPLTLEQVQAA
jgi:signal transduction histidine kinase